MDAFTEEMKAELLKEREELLRKLNNEGADFRSEAMASSGRGDSSDLASDEGAYRKMEAMNALDAKKRWGDFDKLFLTEVFIWRDRSDEGKGGKEA